MNQRVVLLIGMQIFIPLLLFSQEPIYLKFLPHRTISYECNIKHENIVASGSEKVRTAFSSKWIAKQTYVKEISSSSFEVTIHSNCLEFNNKPPHPMFHPAEMSAEIDTNGKLKKITPKGISWFEFRDFDLSTPGFENFGLPLSNEKKEIFSFNSQFATPTYELQVMRSSTKNDKILRFDILFRSLLNQEIDCYGSGTISFAIDMGYVEGRQFSIVSKQKRNKSQTITEYSSKIVDFEK